MCNIQRKCVVTQPIKITDSSVSTRDPRLLHLDEVTWSDVIGHVMSGGAWSLAFSGLGAGTVQRTEPDVVHL